MEKQRQNGRQETKEAGEQRTRDRYGLTGKRRGKEWVGHTRMQKNNFR